MSISSTSVAMTTRTVKVSNLSLGASEQDIKEFFSFSGDIEYVEMQGDTERSQIAFVTFSNSQGAETAVLLSGTTIVDTTVTIAPDPNYKLPQAALTPPTPIKIEGPKAESSFQKAEIAISGILTQSFAFAKDAMNKAKSFDEKHQITSTATAKVASFDKKIGLSGKISTGTSIVNDKVREVDQKLQVSDKTKTAFTVVGQQASSAGSAIINNQYVSTGASWVTAAFNKVAKVAVEVGQKTKERVGMTGEGQRKKVVDDFTEVRLSESPKLSESSVQNFSSKPAPAQGLIL